MTAAFDQQFGQFEFGLESLFKSFGDGQRLRAGELIQRLVEAVKSLLDALDLSNLTPEQKQAILKSIEVAYNTYIKPLDIPYVPNVIEPWVDELVLKTVLEATKKMLGVE